MFLGYMKKILLGAEPNVSFRIPLNPPVEQAKARRYTTERMTIWKESPEALNIGAEIPEEALLQLKTFLGVRRPLTLFRTDVEKTREVFRCAPKKEEAGYQPVVGFADAVSTADIWRDKHGQQRLTSGSIRSIC